MWDYINRESLLKGINDCSVPAETLLKKLQKVHELSFFPMMGEKERENKDIKWLEYAIKQYFIEVINNQQTVFEPDKYAMNELVNTLAWELDLNLKQLESFRENCRDSQECDIRIDQIKEDIETIKLYLQPEKEALSDNRYDPEPGNGPVENDDRENI